MRKDTSHPHFHDCHVCIWECGKERLMCTYTIGTNEVQTLSMRSFSDYLIHFWMAKAHKSPLAAVCKSVHEEEWREVAFDSLRPQTCGDRREKLSNDRNSKWKLVVWNGFISRICASSRKYYSRILHARAAPTCAWGGVADIMAISKNFIRKIHKCQPFAKMFSCKINQLYGSI